MPTATIIEPIELPPAVVEPAAEKQVEAEEAAEFIARQVLERGADFFDG